LLRAIRAFNTAANDARGGWQPQLPLELAVVECTSPLPAASAAPAETAIPARPVARAAAAPVEDSPARAAPEPGHRPKEPLDSVGQAGPEAQAARRAALAPAAPAEVAPGRNAPALRAEWNRLLSLMRERDKATEALLRSCSLLSLEDGVLRLATSEFVFKKISAGSARADVEALLAEVLGFDCTVKLEISSGARGRPGRAGDIPEDGMVATALDLGGEIVE
jgi:hypothetical protein